MHAAHERAALTVAATLLKQARRVLRHAQDAQASTIKLALERVLPVLPAECAGTEPNEESFFEGVAMAFDADTADALQNGEKPAVVEPTPNERALTEQIAVMQKQQQELNEKLSRLLESK
jgi:hypothetical protein